MNKSFTYGAVAGISSLALAIPFLAQISSAASTGSSVATTTAKAVRPAPTQACVVALVAKDDAFLANVDTMIAAQKTATQTHRSALNAAASITDDTQRQAAVKAADEAFRTAMKTAMESHMTADKTQMEALKTACGNAGMGGGMHFEMGMGMGGPGHGGMMKGGMRGNPEGLATKLGMTADELKTALKSGKTIEAIAAEKGITLPARPERGMKHMQQTSSVEQ